MRPLPSPPPPLPSDLLFFMLMGIQNTPAATPSPAATPLMTA